MALAMYTPYEPIGIMCQTSLPLLMAFITDTGETLSICPLTGRRLVFMDETNSANYTIEAAGFKGSGAQLTNIPISAVTDLQDALGSYKKNLASWSGTATVGNTTTETSLLPSTLTIPANTLTGKAWWLRLYGFMSTLASSPGTSQLKVKLGNTTIAATALQTLTVNTTLRTWYLDLYIQCLDATNQWSGGEFQTSNNSNATVVTYPVFNPSGAGSNTSANTSYDQTLDVTWKWTTASTNNTITCKGGVLSPA